jgi:hypothetical protein
MAQSLEKLADRAPPAGPLAPIPGAEATSQEAVPTKTVPARMEPTAETERAPAVPEKVA